MISVVVVTYNEHDTLARTLDSILMQQVDEEVEIVIGDDASTDGTQTVCRDYAHRYPDKFQLLLNSENKGVLNNYVDCLLACRGDLIADCAGDDYWCDPLKLQKELNVMREHPEVTLVHTAWKRLIVKTGKLEDSPRPVCDLPFLSGRKLLEDIIIQTSMPVAHLCTALYRKDAFLTEYNAHPDLFRNKTYACEDVQITLAMALHGDFAYLPDVTLHYSVNPGTISNCANYDKQFHFVERMTKLSYALCNTYGIRSSRMDGYFSMRLYEMLMHSFRTFSRDNHLKALECQHQLAIHDTAKTRFLKFITSNSATWRAALIVRNLVLRICKSR